VCRDVRFLNVRGQEVATPTGYGQVVAGHEQSRTQRLATVDFITQVFRTTLAVLATQLSDWSLTPSGTEGYRKAEVTLGGVNTDGLSSKTMASKTTPGLFFIGEVVDVTGHLGGFNFQWAWASGYAAGQAV